MSLINLLGKNDLTLYSKNLSTDKIDANTAGGRLDIGITGTTVYIKGVPYAPNVPVSTNSFGSSPNNDGITASSDVITLQPASSSYPGGISTGAQSFSGVKTFVDGIVGNLIWTNDNVILGEGACPVLTAGNNVFIGAYSGTAITTGNTITSIGFQSCRSLTTVNSGCFFGAYCGYYVTGNGNNGFGKSALSGAPGSTGFNNSAFGNLSLGSINGGSGNVAMGYQSAINVTNGNNCIHINNVATAGDDNVIRLGTPGTQLKNFQAGIAGVTTDVAAVTCLVSSTGQLGVTSSFKDSKKDFVVLDDSQKEVKALIHSIPNRLFKYNEGHQGLNFGPNIEDLTALTEQFFPDLVAKKEDGSPYAVAVQFLPWLIIHDMQRMQREIDTLKNVISEFTPNYAVI